MLETVKATARKTETGMQVKTGASGFEIIFDEPREEGGADTGMSPVEGVLCALGACQSIVCAAFARWQRFTYEDFWVELEGDLDTEGMTARDPKVRPGFQEIRYSFHFKTNEPQEKIDAFAAFIESRCPVGDSLGKGVRLVLTAAVKE